MCTEINFPHFECWGDAVVKFRKKIATAASRHSALRSLHLRNLNASLRPGESYAPDSCPKTPGSRSPNHQFHKENSQGAMPSIQPRKERTWWPSPQPSFLQPGQVYPVMVDKALNRETGRPDSLEGKGASYNANLPLGKSTLHSHGNYFVWLFFFNHH